MLLEGLFRRPVTEGVPAVSDTEVEALAERLGIAAKARLGRSLSIREVDAGSCNACEIEVNSAGNPYYDMSRFGIKITASPRHADVILVTGPMTRNMHTASLMTYDVAPFPKMVVAFGTCAISGGIFVGGDVVGEGVKDTLNVDVYIPGCPPSPDRLIMALLKALGFSEQ